MTRENHHHCPSIPGSAAVAGGRARTGCAHGHL